MHAVALRRLFTLVTSLLLVVVLAVPAGAAIRFDRIRYDAPGKDTGSNAHLNKEFVVLTNTGDAPRKLGGWRVRDRAGFVYRIPQDFRLKPGRVVRIHTGKGTDDGNDLYWGRGWYVWNNDKDRATLKNAAAKVIDRCAYDDGSKKENVRSTRC